MAHMDQLVTDNGVIMLKVSSFTTKEACQILESRDAPVSKPKGSEVYLYRLSEHQKGMVHLHTQVCILGQTCYY